jgi:hypothetical protein
LSLFALVILTAKAASVLLALSVVWRVPVRPGWAWWVSGGVVVIACAYLASVSSHPRFAYDYQIFRAAGRDVLAGLDPYSAPRFPAHPFLNPPTALPLFAAFAALPARSGLAVWTVLNVLGCLALPFYARSVLASQDRLHNPADGRGARVSPLSNAGLAVLAAALVISDAGLRGSYLGQLGVLTALALLAALDAQGRGRPTLAGVWLALATVKTPTMLPFLILFQRPTDLRSWVALGVTTAALCASTGSPAELPDRLATVARRIGELGARGGVNDYSFEGPQNSSILSIDRALYCLGLRDRGQIRAGQLAAVAAAGAWVARASTRRLPRPAACSLVALYAMTFLYHRDYDTVILALPLVHVAGQAQSGTSLPRRLPAVAATCVILILNYDYAWIEILSDLAAGPGLPARLLRAVMLPYPVWLILIAMICLAAEPSRPDDPSAGLVKPPRPA